MTDDLTELTAAVRERVERLGFELADLRKGGSRQRALLQVRVDRPDATPGHGVTVEDCSVVSRELEAWLDETGRLGPRYILEVSSPGIERPVRWREHWERYTGRRVSVRVPGRGRIRATIVRVLVETESVVLRPEGATEDLTVPLAQARDAVLSAEWDT